MVQTARFPYEERAARVREAAHALKQAHAEWRRAPIAPWDKSHLPPFGPPLADEFWKAMRNALPADFWENAEHLRQGDPAAVDAVVEFLEADPIYFRSGYLKADLVRWLSRVPLTQEQVRRLRQVVLNVVLANWRREFHRYCLLAKRLDGHEFRSQLKRLAASHRPDVKLRADRMLAVLEGKPVQWRGFPVRRQRQ